MPTEDLLTTPVVGTPDTKEPDPAPVTVDLDAPPAAAPAVKPATPASEPAPTAEPSSREKWMENQLAAQRRVIERLDRTVRDLTTRPAAPKPPVPSADILPADAPQATVDKYNALVDAGRWQDAVGLIAETRTQQILKQRDQETAAAQAEKAREQSIQAHLRLLATSKAKVATRYPALDAETGDSAAEEARLYEEAFKQVEQETPEALQFPTAPELVMYRMEDLARQRGMTLKPQGLHTNGGAFSRGSPPRGGTPPSRGGGAPGRVVTLSADDKTFCDFHGIKYEDYAKNRAALVTEGTVTT